MRERPKMPPYPLIAIGLLVAPATVYVIMTFTLGFNLLALIAVALGTIGSEISWAIAYRSNANTAEREVMKDRQGGRF